MPPVSQSPRTKHKRKDACMNSLTQKTTESKPRLIECIHSVKPGRFDANMAALNVIKDYNDSGVWKCMHDAFLFGFLKGQRAERARVKKAGEAVDD